MNMDDQFYDEKTGFRICLKDLESSSPVREREYNGGNGHSAIGIHEIHSSDFSSDDSLELLNNTRAGYNLFELHSDPPLPSVVNEGSKSITRNRISPKFPISPPKNGPLSPISKRRPKSQSPMKDVKKDMSFKDLNREMKYSLNQESNTTTTQLSSSPTKLPPRIKSQPLSQFTSTPIQWSSSPDYHKNETLLTLRLKELEEFNQKSPKKDKTKKIISLAKEDLNVPESLLGPPQPPMSTPAKKLMWNQPITVTRAARLELRRLNIQKRNMSTSTEEVAQEVEAQASNTSNVVPSLHHRLKKQKINKFFLSHEQKKILDIVVNEQQNMFFTGAAGTGKSVLLEKIITDLRKKYTPGSVAVTASTGLAACYIGGTTLHRFAGIGLGKEDFDSLLKRVRKDRKCMKRWKETKVLVIDEISMIDGDLFDKLEQIARSVRRGKNSSKPFGGIQVVITGDFFQLPPVPDRDPRTGLQKDFKFCFEAQYWSEVIQKTYMLRQVFRQKDNTFSTMLNEMRRGEVTHDTIRIFQTLSRPLQDIPIGMTPTELFPLRSQVDRSNGSQLKRLSGQCHIYEATDNHKQEGTEDIYNLNNLMAVSRLDLKPGSQVMMIKNVDETLVNGSLGKVIGFMDDKNFILYGNQGESGILSSQDIEDAQNGKIDLGEKMEEISSKNYEDADEYDDVFGIPGDNEVENDNLSINWKRKRAKLRLLQHKDPVTNKPSGKLWPLVRFKLTDGTTRDVLVQEETWTLENQEGEVMASRTQVPLILAWALSIHKAQGQTLEYVKVDLRRTFEKGQAYVAISRAVRLDGLQVFGFSKEKVMVHDKVIKFYDSLNSVLNEEDERNKKIDLKEFNCTAPRQQLRFDDYEEKPISEVITRVGSSNASLTNLIASTSTTSGNSSSSSSRNRQSTSSNSY